MLRYFCGCLTNFSTGECLRQCINGFQYRWIEDLTKWEDNNRIYQVTGTWSVGPVSSLSGCLLENGKKYLLTLNLVKWRNETLVASAHLTVMVAWRKVSYCHTHVADLQRPKSENRIDLLCPIAFPPSSLFHSFALGMVTAYWLQVCRGQVSTHFCFKNQDLISRFLAV